MKKTIVAGAALIVLGAALLLYQGFRTHGKAREAGSLDAVTEQESSIPAPSVAGGIVLMGGLGLIFYTRPARHSLNWRRAR